MICGEWSAPARHGVYRTRDSWRLANGQPASQSGATRILTPDGLTRSRTDKLLHERMTQVGVWDLASSSGRCKQCFRSMMRGGGVSQ